MDCWVDPKARHNFPVTIVLDVESKGHLSPTADLEIVWDE
jgi:hypothetical protein